MKEKDILKQPWMWLVLGLPAVVVVAGFATLWIAASNPEAIVVEPHRKSGFTVEAVEGNSTALPAQAAPLQPATQLQ